MAAYPVDGLRRNKYWVPVSRIDNAFGDRHVVCACPPMEAYEMGTEGGFDMIQNQVFTDE